MRFDEELGNISKAYYDLGLKKARERDLTGAAGCLKISLRYDKYNKEARNLLGLVFYETGETADALAQWIVSLHLMPGLNDAERYLEEIHKTPGALEAESTLTRRFNQALSSALSGGEDFARIELTDIIKKKPHYMKALNLLTLLSLMDGDIGRARETASEAIKVDMGDACARRYMSEIEAISPTETSERSLSSGSDSHILRTMRPDRAIPYLLIGLILGLLGFYLLILPTVRKSYTDTLNDSLIRNADRLSEISGSYDELENQYEALKSDYAEVSERLNAYEQENLDFTDAYELLNSIVSRCESGDYLRAAEDYVSLNRDNITVEPLVGLLADADRLMLTDGFNAIEELGTEAWNGGNKSGAEEYYNLALSIKADDPEVMYLLARLLQSEDRISEANSIFDKIVGEHPDSPYAERAVEARGY